MARFVAGGRGLWPESTVTIGELLLIFLCGTGVGALGSLLGIGGGLIMVPFLHLLFHAPFRTAIGISLLSIIATASGAASVYTRHGTVAIRLGIVLELATVTGGITGGVIAGRLSEQILSFLFALLLIFTAGTMMRAPQDRAVERPNEPHEEQADTIGMRNLPLGLGGSFVAGISAGLLGIGGGVIKVPLMHEVMGVPFKIATATSTFMMGVTATATALVYYARGDIDPLLAAPMILGILLGANAGARLARRLPTRALKLGFAAFLLYIALLLLLRSWGVSAFRWR